MNNFCKFNRFNKLSKFIKYRQYGQIYFPKNGLITTVQIKDAFNGVCSTDHISVQIFDIDVEENEFVKKGQYVLSFGCLYLTVPMFAPHDGVIKTIYIKEKDIVNTEDLLYTIQSPST